MDTLIISDKKLKIILTADDMRCYNKDGEKLTLYCESSRKIIREIIKKAEKETGIIFDGASTSVEIFENGLGGYELYICNGEQVLLPGNRKRGRSDIGIYSVFADESVLLSAFSMLSDYSAVNELKAYEDRYSGRYLLTAGIDADSTDIKAAELFVPLCVSLGASCSKLLSDAPMNGRERFRLIKETEK